MKKDFFILFMIVFSLQGLVQVIPQSYIHFVTPSNGQTLTSTGMGSTTTNIPVNLQWGEHAESIYGYYIKLFPTPFGTQQSNIDPIDQWWYLAPGTYTWRLELWEYNAISQAFKTAEQTITFYVKHTIAVTNNFGSGNLKIDGITKSSGSTSAKFIGQNLSIGAIDQSAGNYNYLWNQSGVNNSEWKRKPMGGAFSSISGGTPRNFNYTVVSNDNGAILQGILKKICNVTFQNSFVSAGNGGVIKVNSVQYNSPTSSFQVTEANPITATAINQTINGISYTFDHWSDSYTGIVHTFNPTVHSTLSAYFVGKPSNTYRNLHFGTTVGQPIHLYWNEHPNTNVTKYAIWRKVKHNGVMGQAVKINTVNRGTTSYIDNAYALTSTYSDDLIFYDVRAYYSPEDIYSDPDYVDVFGQLLWKAATNDSSKRNAITKYSLINYPNPFNPSTIVNYQLPADGFVFIKVFDALGREIKTLENGFKAKGNYNISFNGADLSSGIYFIHIKVNNAYGLTNFSSTKKMLLLK